MEYWIILNLKPVLNTAGLGVEILAVVLLAWGVLRPVFSVDYWEHSEGRSVYHAGDHARDRESNHIRAARYAKVGVFLVILGLAFLVTATWI